MQKTTIVFPERFICGARGHAARFIASQSVGKLDRGTNSPRPDCFGTSDLQMKARCVMNFGYTQPFSFKLGARTGPKIAAIRHGVTEIRLSDGRLVRATLHVKGVTPNPKSPDALDISYNVITEVLATPSTPILDVHETIQ